MLVPNRIGDGILTWFHRDMGAYWVFHWGTVIIRKLGTHPTTNQNSQSKVYRTWPPLSLASSTSFRDSFWVWVGISLQFSCSKEGTSPVAAHLASSSMHKLNFFRKARVSQITTQPHLRSGTLLVWPPPFPVDLGQAEYLVGFHSSDFLAPLVEKQRSRKFFSYNHIWKNCRTFIKFCLQRATK